MITKFLILCAVLLPLSILAIGQTQLPDFGAIGDLKGMEKVYVSADSTDTRKFILAELKKYPALKVSSSADEAQFVLECTETGRIAVGGLFKELPTFEMTVYTLTNGKKRIAWSKTKTSLRPAARLLTGDFLKELKKADKN
jgi:hypothetical protein